MLIKLKFGTKIMGLTIISVVLPVLVIIGIIQFKTTGVRDIVSSELQQIGDADLTHIVEGIYENISTANETAIKASCMGTAGNSLKIVTLYYDRFKSGEITEHEAKESAAKLILSQRVGKTGYIYVISYDGITLVHPVPKYIGLDMKKFDFIRQQIASGNSAYFEYKWKGPSDDIERSKSLAQERFEPWGWIISASAYKDEFHDLLKLSMKEEMRKMIMAKKIGTSGYVNVIGCKGENKGRYIISYQGKRDNEIIWGTKDSYGKYFIQEMVNMALALKPGQTADLRYSWRNSESEQPRVKLSKFIYYEPWDWLISAGAYENELNAGAIKAGISFDNMNNMIYMSSCILLLVFCTIAFFIIRSIIHPVVSTINGMNESAEQVASASEQVMLASVELAQGASEQAASLEESSASLEEVSSMTRNTAENAGKIRNYMGELTQEMTQASDSMTNLTNSMSEMIKASEKTSDIIKTIDGIAFQTNLLALNAAVEAARAGEAGAGFAVVADEVRNLAMRAATAASSTSDLIEDVIDRIRTADSLIAQNSSNFGKISTKSVAASDLVNNITSAFSEQAQVIEELTKTVSEMDKIVQGTAASSEESASASEELNSQAEKMKEMVMDLFMLIHGDKFDQ